MIKFGDIKQHQWRLMGVVLPVDRRAHVQEQLTWKEQVNKRGVESENPKVVEETSCTRGTMNKRNVDRDNKVTWTLPEKRVPSS